MSEQKYFIGIDIGTQGTKSALVSTEGVTVREAFRSTKLIQNAKKGSTVQDPDELYDSVTEGIKELIQASGISPNQILAVGMDGQMASVIGVDADWNAVTAYDSWLDTRCEKYMPMMKEWGEDKIIEITGAPVSYYHGPKVLWWKHEYLEVYDKVDKFLTTTAYLAGRLAGLKGKDGYIDYTHIHFAGFADVNKMEWSKELLDAFGIDKNKMPSIVNPWDVIGKVCIRGAKASGLLEGTPIIAGCGDTAASAFGAGLTEVGKILDVAGTASVLSCCVDTYNPDAKNKTMLFARSVMPELWAPLAYISGGGQCIAWFKKQIVAKGLDISFDELSDEARKIAAGVEGLIFVPHFAGRACPNNPNIRGTWVGLGWQHNRAALYRSIMESIAYEYKYYLNIIQSLVETSEFSSVISVGGGAKSAFFNQIKANVLDVPYIPLLHTDSAALACIVLAGYGVGYYKDLKSTMDKFIHRGDTINPEKEIVSVYNQYSLKYKKVLEQLTMLYKKI